MTTAAAARLWHAAGLPGRWRGRERFVVLTAGAIGLHGFCIAWKAWRDDPERCAHLHVITLGSRWPALEELVLALDDAGSVAAPGLSPAMWPPQTPDLHRLAFSEGRVQWLVAADAATIDWRAVVADVDAFLIGRREDGTCLFDAGAPAAKAIARVAAAGATFAADGLVDDARGRLEATGFRFAASAPGDAGIARAAYEPAFTSQRPVARSRRAPPVDKHVIVVGAGLAGCAAAWALAEHGWRSTVLERHASIAGEASGNPAGLFHGIVNREDGMHARFNRAAALEAQRAVATALAQHGVRGAASGLLQLVDAGPAAAMRAMLGRLRLPPGYVQALDPDEASARAGLPLARPAWFYPGGGWVDPRGLAQSFVTRAGSATELRCEVEVAALRFDGSQWHVLDASGREIVHASTVVLANAGDALRLVGGDWPVEKVRGQLSLVTQGGNAFAALPRMPVTGSGYLLSDENGRKIFGATTIPGDDDPSVRAGDHLHNLEQLARLAPLLAAAIDPARLQGRTAWRWVSRDRLPLIGAVPTASSCDDASGAARGAACAEDSSRAERAVRCDQVRFIARQPGLFVYTALGSRGITWCALGAQVLAASITGAPAPVEARVLDALDPARFRVRASRAGSRLALTGPREEP